MTPVPPTTATVDGRADETVDETVDQSAEPVEDETADQTTDDATTNDATNGSAAAESTEPVIERLAGVYSVEVVGTLPHDPTAYTQGLELDGDRLLETTGLYGESQRRWIDVTTGSVMTAVSLPDEFFGEGATIVNGQILQLTWQSETMLIADGQSLVETGRGSYSGEGWGLCFDGQHLVMSNGSSTLTFRDPDTFEVVRSVSVTDANGAPVERLNELECVGEQVLANIYGLDSIAVIDPATGTLDAAIDAASLRPANAPADDFDYVLNGIAYNADAGTYYLTGKWWDVLYEVRLVAG